MIKKKRRLLAAVAVCSALLLWLRPADEYRHYSAYYSNLNKTLQREAIGPVAFIDLERLDHNIAAVQKNLPDHISLRIVTKSLPSIELIQYILKASQTNKLMTFHQPYMKLLAKSLRQPHDMLLGKPLPVGAAADFYQSVGRTRHRVQWLVDSPERLQRYLALAEKLQRRLLISLEIDVGLHRGGFRNNGELGKALEIIKQNKAWLEFSGFMGYDGHIAETPWAIFGKHGAMQREYKNVLEKYEEFVAYTRKNYAGLWHKKLTLNGAGSKTYQLYKNQQILNDIAMGSGFVKPARFELPTLQDHRRALFIATPVLKKIEKPAIPFVGGISSLFRLWNPNWYYGFYVYGGAWAADRVAPEGLVVNIFYGENPNENLVPNQTLLNASSSALINVGDYVFYYPRQGDAIVQFKDVLAVRDNRVERRFRPFRSGF